VAGISGGVTLAVSVRGRRGLVAHLRAYVAGRCVSVRGAGDTAVLLFLVVLGENVTCVAGVVVSGVPGTLRIGSWAGVGVGRC
jgi:hypothetical protein